MNVKELHVLRDIEKVFIQEDAIIVAKEPKVLERYGKKIIISPINWYYDWDKFTYWLGLFLQAYYISCNLTKLPDNLNDIKEFIKHVRLAIGANKDARKSLEKLCAFSKINVWNKIKWMRKNFDLYDWIEVFDRFYDSSILYPVIPESDVDLIATAAS